MDKPMVFRLLDLPPELRNKVYGHVFEGGEITVGTIHGHSYPYETPGLLLANKTIRLEALPVFYQASIFYVLVFEDLMKFLRKVGHHSDPITRVRVVYTLVLRSMAKHVLSEYRQCVETSGLQLRNGALQVEVEGPSYPADYIWGNEFGEVARTNHLEIMRKMHSFYERNRRQEEAEKFRGHRQ